TGLYFFAFLAVVEITSGPAQSESNGAPTQAEPGRVKNTGRRNLVWSGAAVLFSLAVFATSLKYSISLLSPYINIKGALVAAQAGNLRLASSLGESATNSDEPTHAYDFLFAQALVRCAERLKRVASNGTDGEPRRRKDRDEALQKAAIYGKKSL